MIVLKQPDVFSQARMTRFRTDFENQMSADLANFHLVLAARINRLDSATTTQTTALGAALAAPGTTNVTAPKADAATVLGTTNTLFNNSSSPSLFGSQIMPNQGTFGGLGLATNNFNPINGNSPAAASALGVGVDPTVYLDEKKRFLDHLNEIRRINLGPDQNDSSGYGLYLVRLPVSITPGECTYHGFGADLSIQVEHEFGPEFLPTTFRNLVINDVVDQLGPFVYEVVRSGFYDKYLVQLLLKRDELKRLRIEKDKYSDPKIYSYAQRQPYEKRHDDFLAEFRSFKLTCESMLSVPALASVRSAKQFYPIVPRELLDFFLPENIYLLAKDANDGSRTRVLRAVDVRNNLRHALGYAFDVMSSPPLSAQGSLPPLGDPDFMGRLRMALDGRRFGPGEEVHKSPLENLFEELVARLENRANIKGRPIAAICWAIAVDAALLDSALQTDAKKVFETKGMPADFVDGAHFYYPKGVANDPGRAVFNDYVKHRWPIITFALDPVTDQQNIADSFNLKRDLQLALSFAFATGQINFSQLSTFQRKIEQSSDTIALNRTVTGFSHENDIFGFRFTPRFQNPPQQRTNIGVIASQLIGGGPGPDYQMRKSKLEPGMRELTAVLLIPTFLPTMRMHIAGNWFKLNDPEHLVFHTKRMMERGRRVQELKQAIIDTCSAEQYRDADNRVLQSKLAQLEAMLPMQSRVVQLPFDNAASGFDLFSDGSTALVPELTGYSGVDVIQPAAGATVASATAAGPPALTVASTSTATGNFTTTSIVGGTSSIADLFVFGKYISLVDTKVIAGGRSASFEILSREVVHVQIPANVIATTTSDGNSYVEVFIATPNGTSNSLLIPYNVVTPVRVAYDVDPQTQSVDVFYQWLTGPDGKSALIASAPPKPVQIGITWKTDTGLAPKRIQAQFTANVGGQLVAISVPGDAASTGDYKIDAQLLAATLLSRLQGTTAPLGAIQSPIVFTVKVQPWIPASTEGVRIQTDARELTSKVTVNMNPYVSGVNALPNVIPAFAPPPAPKGAAAASTMNDRIAARSIEDGVQIAARPDQDRSLVVHRRNATTISFRSC